MTKEVLKKMYQLLLTEPHAPTLCDQLESIAREALAQPEQEPDALTIAYQSGYYEGKKAALAGREWNFCERCGKRTADLTVIHTCTPPQKNT